MGWKTYKPSKATLRRVPALYSQDQRDAADPSGPALDSAKAMVCRRLVPVLSYEVNAVGSFEAFMDAVLKAPALVPLLEDVFAAALVLHFARGGDKQALRRDDVVVQDAEGDFQDALDAFHALAKESADLDTEIEEVSGEALSLDNVPWWM